MAESPSLDDNDVEVEVANGVVATTGEKKAETKDKGRLFGERCYGRFERRIPVEDVDEEKVAAAFNLWLAAGHTIGILRFAAVFVQLLQERQTTS